MKSTCIRQFADQKQIKRCKNKVERLNGSLTAVSKALNLAGNEVRLTILLLLNSEKRLCVCDLSDVLNMSIPAVSQHLRRLKDAGLIDFKREGTLIYYFIAPKFSKSLETLLGLL